MLKEWRSYILSSWCARCLEDSLEADWAGRSWTARRHGSGYAVVLSFPSTLSNPPNSSQSSVSGGAIAGAVVGGVVGLTLILTAALLLHRRARRRRRLTSAGGVIAPQDHAISPFVLDAAPPPARNTRRARGKGPLAPNRYPEPKLREHQGTEPNSTATPPSTNATSSTPAVSTDTDPSSPGARPSAERTRPPRGARRPRRARRQNISKTELRELTSEVQNLRQAMEDLQTERIQVFPGYGE